MLAERIANIAIGGGSGTAVMFGLTPSEWSVIGVIGGLVIGFLGLVLKGVVDWHFKAAHLKLAQDRARVLADVVGDDA